MRRWRKEENGKMSKRRLLLVEYELYSDNFNISMYIRRIQGRMVVMSI